MNLQQPTQHHAATLSAGRLAIRKFCNGRSFQKTRFLLSALLVFLAVSTAVFAQNLTVPIKIIYADLYNVPGIFQSGQEVCNGRRSYLGSFVPPLSYQVVYPHNSSIYLCGAESGGCSDGWQHWAFPATYGVCPFGWSAKSPGGACTVYADSNRIQTIGWLQPISDSNPILWIDPYTKVCERPANQPDYSKTAGAPSCGTNSPFTPNPINTGTGNKYLGETDLSTPTLQLTRSYNHLGDSLAARNNGKIPSTSTDQGNRWRNNYQRILQHDTSTNLSSITAVRGDGRSLYFTQTTGQTTWTPEADNADRLTQTKDTAGNTTGWTYYDANTQNTETYTPDGKLQRITDPAGNTTILTYTDGTNGLSSSNGGYILDTNGNPTNTVLPAGLLLRVTDPQARTIQFGYDGSNRIVRLTDPAGNVTRYGYDGPSAIVLPGQSPANNLTSVTYPDGTARTYHYNEQTHTSAANLPNALTGITDQNGVRYANYLYDATGRAIDETHAGNVDRYQLSFTTDASGNPQTTVTDPLGTARTTTFQNILGVLKPTAQTQPAGSGCGPAGSQITYDANGNVASQLDFNGNRTTYQYDLTRNLETARTEGLTPAGATTPATRTTTTTWHPTLRLPTQILEKNSTGNTLRQTDITYDTRGNPTSHTVQDNTTGITRSTTHTLTYSTLVPGQIDRRITNGPRTDLLDTTTTDYWPANALCAGSGTGYDKGCRGQIKQTTDAAGNLTQYTRYNPYGQVEQIIAPNGLTTTLQYDPRQRLTHLTHSDGTTSQTTQYQYTPAGQLSKLIQPDASQITYTYDAAQRLTQIQDTLGNRITYTLDAMGNRIQEDTRDPNGTLIQTLQRSMDALNRVQQLVGR